MLKSTHLPLQIHFPSSLPCPKANLKGLNHWSRITTSFLLGLVNEEYKQNMRRREESRSAYSFLPLPLLVTLLNLPKDSLCPSTEALHFLSDDCLHIIISLQVLAVTPSPHMLRLGLFTQLLTALRVCTISCSFLKTFKHLCKQSLY